MNGIGLSVDESSVKNIKALLSLNFRIALYAKGVQVGPGNTPGVGETIEYHFVRDKQYDDIPNFAELEMQVNCVLCKSRIGDSLKICGLKKPFSELQALFQNQRLTGNYTLFFERQRIAVFPFDWYPCFEKIDLSDPRGSNDPRWKEIEATIKMLPSIAEELANKEEMIQKRKKDKEDAAKREKEEKERLKREEENKKREESRKKMEELAKSLEMLSKAEDHPDNFTNFMNSAMKKK